MTRRPTDCDGSKGSTASDLRCTPALFGAVAIVLTGCSSDNSAANPLPKDAGADGTTDAAAAAYLAVPCADTKDAVYQAPAGLPAFDASRRGDVVRCALDNTYSADDMKKGAATLGYGGKIMTSGVTSYRFAYRTQRVKRTDGTTPEGLASARLFFPSKPRADEGKMPLVVIAHGTVGIASRCAPSRSELLTAGDHLDDYRSVVLPLAAAGWVVVAPDYPGYGYDSTPGYMLAEDAAHGLLDATRAARKLLKKGLLSDKNTIVGHSQGGHGAISAQAYAGSYGLDGALSGVATFAPMWFSQLSFAAMMHPIAGFTTAQNPFSLYYSLAYFFSHGENLDGPGHGLDMLKPEKKSVAAQILASDCMLEQETDMPKLGATPADYIDATFVNDVGSCGAFGTCTAGAAAVWGPRCKADRPSIDPHGAPIVIWQGGADTTVSPGLAACGMDRLHKDLASAADATTTVTLCADPTATHSGFITTKGVDLTAAITRRSIDWVDQWIAARTLGAAEPPACKGLEALGPDGGAPACATPPPNE